jgi:AraC family transcriptional regulator of adaptative response/methylated-DNA-[protein]-cysteine methyltransferase
MSKISKFNKILDAINLYIENKTLLDKNILNKKELQNLFTEWCGVNFDIFISLLEINYIKDKLKNNINSKIDLNNFIIYENTNNKYDLLIKYSFKECQFGKFIIASTNLGVCYLAFEQNLDKAFIDLKSRFKFAEFKFETDNFQLTALNFILNKCVNSIIHLHLFGTEFELKIWKELLKISAGKFSTYKYISENIENKFACRAVGTAIGKNPIAYIIPCHRVVKSTGMIGGYRWGTNLKSLMIGWEQAKYYNSF